MMPKGYKSMHGYATVSKNNGLGFREISEIMSKSGNVMNHATARNILIRGLLKIARPICELHGIPRDKIEEEALKTANDPRFQDAICELLSESNRTRALK